MSSLTPGSDRHEKVAATPNERSTDALHMQDDGAARVLPVPPQEVASAAQGRYRSFDDGPFSKEEIEEMRPPQLGAPAQGHEANPATEPDGSRVPQGLRSVKEIRATGAAWVTEAELEWLCGEAVAADAYRKVVRDGR